MITTKQQNIATKVLLVLTAVLAALLVMKVAVKPARAQEITPAADTYSYGSTSEFSPYVAINTSSATLATTGVDQTVGYLVAVAAIGGAGAMLYLYRRQTKIS